MTARMARSTRNGVWGDPRFAWVVLSAPVVGICGWLWGWPSAFALGSTTMLLSLWVPQRNTLWFPCWRWIVTLVMLVALTGCGTSGQGGDAPEAIHARWVAALHAADRGTALALAAAQQDKAGFVDTSIDRMRAKKEAAGSAATVQEVQPLTSTGAQRSGISVWVFGQRTECWRTTLVEQDGAWRVLQWAQATPCPTNS